MKEVVVRKFRTVNVSDLPYRLKDDEVAFAVNMDILDDFTMQQRPGSALIEAIGTNVQLFQFNEIRDGIVTEHLIALGGTKAWRFNGTTFDEIATGLTDSERYGGVGFIDAFVFSNGVDLKQFKWDGVSAYSVTDITDIEAPGALLWAEFQSRVFACKDGSENLYWSEIGDHEAWDANDFIALGAMPTDLKVAGEYLFIGTDRNLLKITATGDATAPFKLDYLINVGVVPNTIQEVSPGVLGCWLVNGEFVVFNQYAQSGSELVSKYGDPVKAAMRSVNLTEESITSFVDNSTGKVTYSMNTEFPIENVSDIFTDTTDNNVQFVLNNSHLGWTFYNLQIRSMASFGGEVYYSDFSGNVLKFSPTLYQDNEVEFVSRVITKIYDDGRGDLRKGYRRFWLSSNSKTKTQINVGYAVSYAYLAGYSEDELFYAYGGIWGSSRWGEFLWGGGVHRQLNTLDLDIYGSAIQFIFDKNYDNADMQLTSFNYSYVPSTQEAF